jgi:predicted alpha/beta superfamily hydrolase
MRSAPGWGILAASLLSIFSTAQAALLPAKAVTVPSMVLHQDRPIEVYLPEESAQDPERRFETLYVLDGDWNAKIVADTVNFMRQLGMMPPVIVVSVPNPLNAQGRNSRDHDLTPSPIAGELNSGGAADFLQFLRAELVPYVNRKYPSNGVNLIHGHSYGGLFLMYVLANDPQLFDGYIVLDPAMSWDHYAVTASLATKLAQLPASGKAIYIAGRSGAGFKEMGLDGLQAAFQANAAPTLHWTVVSYEDETHDSLKLKGTYDGLKYLYGGYTQEPVGIGPSDGIVVKNWPIRLSVFGRRVRAHYTRDGSDPTEAAALIDDGGILAEDPESIRIKLLSNRGLFDQAIVLHIKTGVPLIPSAPGKGGSADVDWHYAVYRAEAWPRFGDDRAISQGSTERELAFEMFKEKHFAAHIWRRVLIPEDGYYVFYMDTEHGRLTLDGRTLMSLDGDTPHGTQTYLAPLRRGIYLLSLDVLGADEHNTLHVGVIRCREDEPEWWNQQPWLALEGH